MLTDRVRIFDEPEGVARGHELIASAFDGLAPDDVTALNALLGRWIEALGRERPTPPGPADGPGER